MGEEKPQVTATKSHTVIALTVALFVQLVIMVACAYFFVYTPLKATADQALADSASMVETMKALDSKIQTVTTNVTDLQSDMSTQLTKFNSKMDTTLAKLGFQKVGVR